MQYSNENSSKNSSDLFKFAGNFFLVFFATFVLVALVWFFVGVSVRGNLANAEIMVIEAKDACVSTYDNGIKSIIENAQVDQNTKDYLIDLIKGNKQGEVNENYEQLLNGNPAPFIAMMGTMSNTNFTITSENLQREISIRRSEMINCSKGLNSAKTLVRSASGMDASGRIVVFPQKYIFSYGEAPSEITDNSLRDNDGDGRLTVLDYQPPVNINISESFGTGEDTIGTLDLYGE